MPPLFIDAFRGGLVLARGYERCIVMYTADEWASLADEMAALPKTHPGARRLARFMFSTAQRTEIDRQGRLELPRDLRSYAKIGVELIVVGAGTTVELWDSQVWAAEQEWMLSGISDIAACTGSNGAVGMIQG